MELAIDRLIVGESAIWLKLMPREIILMISSSLGLRLASLCWLKDFLR
jgi:hypothetical protein